MRSKDFEENAIPVIMGSIKSGETTVEEQIIFQTQLLMGILMALNDMLTMIAVKPAQHVLDVSTLPISA